MHLSGDQVDEGERMSLSEPWSQVNWYKRIREEIPNGELFQDEISDKDVNRDIILQEKNSIECLIFLIKRAHLNLQSHSIESGNFKS